MSENNNVIIMYGLYGTFTANEHFYTISSYDLFMIIVIIMIPIDAYIVFCRFLCILALYNASRLPCIDLHFVTLC